MFWKIIFVIVTIMNQNSMTLTNEHKYNEELNREHMLRIRL